MIKIPDNIIALKPYKAGSQQAIPKDIKRIIHLASNENPLGPSPKAIDAVKNSAHQVNSYPDPASVQLRNELAALINKKPEQIMFGHGSNSLITHVVNAFSDYETEVLTASGTFVGIFVNTFKLGRTVKTVPLVDYAYDLGGISENISEKTRIIYLANPNNPTSSMFSKTAFETFMNKVPKNVLVLLDEAYYNYALVHDEYPDGLSYDCENLIVLRTFSKTHGLAGLRIGFAVGPEELIATLYKVKLAFEPNLLAQEAALAGLSDDAFVRKTISLNNEMLPMMKKAFDDMGIENVKPYGNFIMVLFPSEKMAVEFSGKCLSRGVMVRPVGSFGVPNGVRINTGTEEDTIFALKVFEEEYSKMLQLS